MSSSATLEELGTARAFGGSENCSEGVTDWIKRTQSVPPGVAWILDAEIWFTLRGSVSRKGRHVSNLRPILGEVGRTSRSFEPPDFARRNARLSRGIHSPAKGLFRVFRRRREGSLGVPPHHVPLPARSEEPSFRRFSNRETVRCREIRRLRRFSKRGGI